MIIPTSIVEASLGCVVHVLLILVGCLQKINVQFALDSLEAFMDFLETLREYYTVDEALQEAINYTLSPFTTCRRDLAIMTACISQCLPNLPQTVPTPQHV